MSGLNPGHALYLHAQNIASAPIPVTSGQPYTIGISGELVSCTCSGPYRLQLAARMFSGGSYVTDTLLTSQTVSLGKWVRLQQVWTIPAGIDGVHVALITQGASGDLTLRADAALLAAGDVGGNYMDGNSPGATWDGTPSASSSTGYAGATSY